MPADLATAEGGRDAVAPATPPGDQVEPNAGTPGGTGSLISAPTSPTNGDRA